MSDEKVLWVVHYQSLADFVAQAVAVGASGVAIRSDNNLLLPIDQFHQKGIKVFGWRWPSSKYDSAMDEANAIGTYLSKGLDGYFVDPEGAPGKSWNWDQSGLEQTAIDFCTVIKNAAPDKPLGVTSHYRADKTFPKLPWKTFFGFADVCLPQAYWRSTEGTIGHGLPVDNYRTSQTFWAAAGAPPEKIVPMAGELGVSTAAEVVAYSAEAARQGITRRHFYAYDETVKASVWSAVAK